MIINTVHIYYSDQLTLLRNICYNFAGVKASGEITIFARNHCLLYVTWCKITGQESHNNYHLHQYLSWKKFTGKSFDFFYSETNSFFAIQVLKITSEKYKQVNTKQRWIFEFLVQELRVHFIWQFFTRSMKTNGRVPKPLLACWYVTW